ncbi:hypothetical protein QYE76_007286 [Lolium multiflorum]|uniref:Reverse transcriptase domain-containing protein n=1 Tax=Lolium multiflorum TaxID=4521 RepID=A0AAD8W565_LOLMU|nr:hypothetical protein QYE76_007286 [Lolium multiflorum]
MENYSLLMGDSSVDGDGGDVDGEAFRGHFPVPAACRNRDSCPPDLGFAMAAHGWFLVPWLIRIDVLDQTEEEDQELTVFITPHDVFCYNVMTFGLKNAGSTYQRCMQACLGEQIGRNIEVYIDDIVVKTKHAATLIDDLRETFDNLDKYKIKLNPKKCFFGIPWGQVLGYFISARGIEANPLKIKAILDMEPPRIAPSAAVGGTISSAQRFIAKLGKKLCRFIT